MLKCGEHFDATFHVSSEEAFRLVWDAIPTIFPVNNPPHPVIAKRKAPTYRVDI